MDKQLNAVYVDIKEELPKDFLAQLSENDWVCIDNIEDASNAQIIIK
jgi:DnaA family protein